MDIDSLLERLKSGKDWRALLLRVPSLKAIVAGLLVLVVLILWYVWESNWHLRATVTGIFSGDDRPYESAIRDQYFREKTHWTTLAAYLGRNPQVDNVWTPGNGAVDKTCHWVGRTGGGSCQPPDDPKIDSHIRKSGLTVINYEASNPIFYLGESCYQDVLLGYGLTKLRRDADLAPVCSTDLIGGANHYCVLPIEDSWHVLYSWIPDDASCR